MSKRIPIVVLGGSDRQPGKVPSGLSAEQMLTGFKGAQALPWGRTLAGELIERLRRTDCFVDPVLIGPQSVYQGRVDAEIVNAEGSLVVSIRTAMRFIRQRYEPSEPVAVIACDVLPEAEELKGLLEAKYLPHAECMFWWQMVRARADDLGASHWKPSYWIRPSADEEPLPLYPGHLAIVRPEALRVGLASSLLELAYRYRNRDIRRRYIPLILRSLRRLVAEDLRNLLRLQLPILTVSLPLRGLWGYRSIQQRKLTIDQFERNLARLLLHRRFHHAADDRPVVVAITEMVSLAKDIDTQAELAEAAASGPA